MSEYNDFVDILKPRNTQFGIFRFMTRSWIPKKTFILDKSYTPQELKELVVNSVFMDTFLNAESARQGVSVKQLKKEMLQYLDEMAFEKKIHIVRWVGLAFLKICFMMKISVFVNEPVVLKLRASMGSNPVLFLPTHRSYADFCLMTYLCFHYDIDLPAVAAGMDFHDMAVVGQRMREMCAFYMRRSLIGAPLYAATLKQYVRTVVARHCAPVEFFIEGTRSRSNKSLIPKFGMLSMTLLPYFAREVSDVTIVPVNISYDRLIEATLFAYEHLGVPKPRESTEGLLKSLQSLNDNYGNVYVNLGTPISLNEFLKQDPPSTSETLKPVDLQELTAQQTEAVRDIAYHVVAAQQQCTVVTMPSLLSMVVMQSLFKNRPLHLDEVVQEVQWLSAVFASVGARVLERDAAAAVRRVLRVHARLFSLDGESRLQLVSSANIKVTPEVRSKMRGHTLKAETMMNAVPVIELQTYVNPLLHYLLPSALLLLVIRRGVRSMDHCYHDYRLLRIMLSFEFFYIEKYEEETFDKALDYCIKNGVIARGGGSLSPGTDERLQYLLQWVALPALTTLTHCIDVMREEQSCTQRRAQRLAQARGEAARAHAYSLSLEAAAHCLAGLAAAGALRRRGRGKDTKYEAVPQELQKCCALVRTVMPKVSVDFGAGNSVIASRAHVASRL